MIRVRNRMAVARARAQNSVYLCNRGRGASRLSLFNKPKQAVCTLAIAISMPFQSDGSVAERVGYQILIGSLGSMSHQAGPRCCVSGGHDHDFNKIGEGKS